MPAAQVSDRAQHIWSLQVSHSPGFQTSPQSLPLLELELDDELELLLELDDDDDELDVVPPPVPPVSVSSEEHDTTSMPAAHNAPAQYNVLM